MNTLITVAIMVIITVWMLRKKMNIGWVMLTNSLVMIIVKGISLDTAYIAIKNGALSSKTITIVIIIYMIMTLEVIMRDNDMFMALAVNLKHTLRSNRLSAAALPMVVGMLPSPGSARLSCPMVEEVTRNSKNEEIKAFINYWFRHGWREAFVLFPHLLVAAEIAGVDSLNLSMHILPFSAVAVLIGTIFGLLKMEKETIPAQGNRKKYAVEFLKNFMPIILTIGLYTLLAQFGLKNLGLFASVLTSIMLLFVWKKYSLERVFNTVKKVVSSPKYLIIIVGVMIFKEVLYASTMLDQIPALVEAYHISPFILFIVVPMLGSISTGIMMSAITISFPILMPLGLGENIWYVAVAYVAATSGALMTPVHLCATMSAEYFKSSLNKMLLRSAMAEVFMIIVLTIVLLLA